MDQSLHTPKPYDYRQYDRIWQRVAPELEPYPGWKEQAVPALADLTPKGHPERSEVPELLPKGLTPPRKRRAGPKRLRKPSPLLG